MNNLDLIVNFCENMVDCRRSLQLDYFGEHFTRDQCLLNKTTACDNCSRVTQFKEVDATDTCKMVVNAVEELGKKHRHTILQMVDVFKGALTKKIVDEGLDRTKFHGHLKPWERSDIQRIFHKLITVQYLKEEIIIFRDIPQAYIKLGPKVEELMRPGSKVRVMFAMTDLKSNAKSKKDEVNVQDSKADELSDKCYHDLMDIARSIAEEKGLTINQVMNMQALKDMSRKMPESESQMLLIPHVTKANFDKYGKRFLEITIPYSLQRSLNSEDMADEDIGDYEDDDGKDWDALAREASTSSVRGTGSKRKMPSSGWGKSKPKRYRGNTSRSKKKSPVKKKPAAGKARGPNLLPRPTPQF